jgi:hypothetical protein
MHSQDPVSPYRLTPRDSAAGCRCRCGSKVPGTARCWAFAKVPTPLASLLSGQEFCGALCARAYLLEALSLEGSTAAVAVLSDADAVFEALRLLLSVVEVDLRTGAN